MTVFLISLPFFSIYSSATFDNLMKETLYSDIYLLSSMDDGTVVLNKNADRKIMIGDVEVVKFGADGNVSVGEAYQPYDVDAEYKVTIKADSFVMQRELAELIENSRI